MPQSWLERQSKLVHERAKAADIVISTALIPGRDAPTLLPVETVLAMKPGSVVIDLAAGRGPVADRDTGRRGGNCPLAEADEVVVTENGVQICGYTNMASLVCADASALYARNVLDFLKIVINKEGKFEINMDDDIVAATLFTNGVSSALRAA